VAAAVRTANARLPDYAQVGRWFVADEPFTAGNGLLTASGALRRLAVRRRYRDQIDQLYEGEDQHVAV
jgi:long-subunit acyl-CoA synthetase (AMP-forming)